MNSVLSWRVVVNESQVYNYAVVYCYTVSLPALVATRRDLRIRHAPHTQLTLNIHLQFSREYKTILNTKKEKFCFTAIFIAVWAALWITNTKLIELLQIIEEYYFQNFHRSIPISVAGLQMWCNGVSRYKIITIVLAVRNNGKMQLSPYTTETCIIYIYITFLGRCTCEQTKSRYSLLSRHVNSNHSIHCKNVTGQYRKRNISTKSYSECCVLGLT